MVAKSTLITVLSAAVLGGAALNPVSAAAVVEPPATTPPSPEVTAPLKGKLKLTLQDAHGHPAFAAIGERIVIAGGVRPYVAGQKVVVSIYRNGHRVLSKRLGVSQAAGGAGGFHFGYESPHSGHLSIRAEHIATPQLAKLVAKPVSVRYELSTLSLGSRGRVVRLLQEELSRLHYQVNVTGYYDETTGRAVVAFRKVAGQARVESVNARIFQLIQRGAGVFHVRYPSDGAHVEADLSKQVLAEIEKGGRVRRIITISSGKPSTPTVVGRFHVYRKEPGTNSHGMVDSSYFIGGYAIHGYAEVPTYAASHGCLRIPVPDAAAVYEWVKFGYAVDVYTHSGRGSHTVRNNAGP